MHPVVLLSSNEEAYGDGVDGTGDRHALREAGMAVRVTRSLTVGEQRRSCGTARWTIPIFPSRCTGARVCSVNVNNVPLLFTKQ